MLAAWCAHRSDPDGRAVRSFLFPSETPKRPSNLGFGSPVAVCSSDGFHLAGRRLLATGVRLSSERLLLGAGPWSHAAMDGPRQLDGEDHLR